MSEPEQCHNGRPLRGSCLRHTAEDGSQTVCWPGDALFSTYTMVAQEYFDGNEWLPTAIDLDD